MRSINYHTLKALGRVSFYSEEEEARLALEAAGGNEKSRDALVRSMMPLALKESRRYYLFDTPSEDIVQEIFMAVCRAVHCYRPGKGRLSSYVGASIRNAMSRKIKRSKKNPVQATKRLLDTIARLEKPEAEDEFDDREERDHRMRTIENVAVRTLTTRDLYIFNERNAGRSAGSLADEMGVCRQRIEQIFSNCLFKIRRKILGKMPDPST